MPALSLSTFLQSLGWALLNSLWQMALLWLVYSILVSAFFFSPSRKNFLAFVCLTTGFTWFLLSFFAALKVASPFYFIREWSGFIYENKKGLFIEKILYTGSIVYLFFLSVPIGKFIRNYRYVQRIQTTGLSKIDAEWRLFVKRSAAAMGITKSVEVWLSSLVQSPVTVGFLKPIILIPAAALTHLTPQQVEAILVHELSHIRRLDYLFNLLIHLIKTILYFNPFVNLFIKTIEREREKSCDENVIQHLYSPADYASALLLLEKLQSRPMLLAAAGKESDLLHRIETILGIRKRTNHSLKRMVASVFTIAILALMNILYSVRSEKPTHTVYFWNSPVSPYYFMNSTNESFVAKASVTVNYKPVKKPPVTTRPFTQLQNSFSAHTVPPPVQYVNFITPAIPELPAADELAVKETMEAVKKILEEKEWKEIENSLADSYTSLEKLKLKNEFRKEINNKVDWTPLEARIRFSYHSIDWNKVNEQVGYSLAQIQLDSLQQALQQTVQLLCKVENQMNDLHLSAVPDSDITLEQIVEKKQKATTLLDQIKIIRKKKIIRL